MSCNILLPRTDASELLESPLVSVSEKMTAHTSFVYIRADTLADNTVKSTGEPIA